jgi:hypothetical protein
MSVTTATDLHETIDAIRSLSRHQSMKFSFPRGQFFDLFEQLIQEVDEMAEFVCLEARSKSFELTVRHR